MKALAVYLTGRQRLPVERAAEVISELLGAPVSTGFIVSVQVDPARRLAEFILHVKAMLGRAVVVHVDETSTRVSAAKYWVHVACTSKVTLLCAHHRRGREAITDIDVLPGYRGVLVRFCTQLSSRVISKGQTTGCDLCAFDVPSRSPCDQNLRYGSVFDQDMLKSLAANGPEREDVGWLWSGGSKNGGLDEHAPLRVGDTSRGPRPINQGECFGVDGPIQGLLDTGGDPCVGIS